MQYWPALRQCFKPDPQGLVDTILRKDTPKRVHFIELFQDQEIVEALAQQFDLTRELDSKDPDFARKRNIAVQRFSGFDYVRAGLAGLQWPLQWTAVEDTAELKKTSGRHYLDEHTGPIGNWETFEKYPWPDPDAPAATRDLEWYSKHLPDDMCIIGSGGFGHLAEHLTWLMGYETLCYALSDQRDLVEAIARKLEAIYASALKRILEFPRVKIIWGSDDMGFKTGLMISPDDTRKLVLKGHRELATMAHAAGRPYILHACGNLSDIIDDLVNDVKIDGKHSFEDAIEDVCEVKRTYGRHISLLGGIDVDFLCRAGEQEIRARVRKTLDICMPGGGYCLGTGNSVANYIPLDNYLAMIDEGRRYAA